MQRKEKQKLILDAMQRLLLQNNAQSISVSDIAREAGMGKGSVYYYFKSKEDILEAVIERSYSSAIDEAKKLLVAPDIDALTKMKIIFGTCRDSSLELMHQETNNFFELQQTALFHQQFISIMIKNLHPILTDIICQGNLEGSMDCKFPREAAEIVMIILTIKLDSHYSGNNKEQVQKTLDVFAYMLETSFHIKKGRLNFLWQENPKNG